MHATASSTVGGVAEHVDQPVELGAHARAEQRVVVDDDDARHGSITSSTSVPVPGVLWIVARPPWRSMRAIIESRTPRRSAGAASGSKPGPAVAHEDLGAAVLDLGVERDRLRAGELGRVHERLAGGGDQRARALVERAVADGHDLDRHVVVGLDLGRGGLQRARERRRAGGPRVVQPGAQLALLAAGERGDLARVVGALLDERERLQHGVVQVRGDLGALLRADARGALGGQAAHEPDPPRREDDRDRDQHDRDRQDHVASRRQRIVEARGTAARRRSPARRRRRRG